MPEIKKILMTKNAKKFFVRDTNQDVHTQYGYIKKEDLSKSKDGEKLKSNTGDDFTVFSPFFSDLYRKIKRNAQIIPLKDLCFIIAETGISGKSTLVDAGSGSGALACFLANIAKKVTTYDIREDFIEVVKSNIKFLELKNITIKNKDVYQSIDEKNVDLITLDVPEPWLALDSCSKSLKPGGFLVSYSPSVPQVADFVNAVRKRNDFIHTKTSEIIEREWEVEDRKVRPKSISIGHSGFMSIVRKF